MVRLAFVAVLSNGSILVGRRKDNGKWTMPGGHLDENEKAYDGARRELFEEAGISAPYLYSLGHEQIVGFSGKALDIHAFRFDTTRRPTFTSFDPDNEISEWKFVPLREDTPELQREVLHAPRNVVLKALGLDR